MDQMHRLFVVASKHDWHTGEIVRAAKEEGVACEVVVSTGALSENASKGDVILWRSSALSSPARTALLAKLRDRGCVIVNEALIDTPFVRSKIYQQARIAGQPRLRGIVTHQFANAGEVLRAVREGRLAYPCIAKPHIGSQGRGVLLIQSPADVYAIPQRDFAKLIFQPYIHNNGDYRVVIVGGVALGVMKRIGKPGEHRNNISQGGRAELVNDQHESAEVKSIAVKASTVFGLQVCGVDIIRDAETGLYHFLEVNTVPEWDGTGFQHTVMVDVAKEIVRYAGRLLLARERPFYEVVKEMYCTQATYMPSIAFHWYSRMYLWTGNHEYRAALARYRSHVFGEGDDVSERFADVLADEKQGSYLPAARLKMLERFDVLKLQSVLAKTMFARTVYGEDVCAVAFASLGKERLLRCWRALHADPHALLVMSTFAVNAVTMINEVFGKKLNVALDPHLFRRALDEALQHSAKYRLRDVVYLATHAVIGASAFYSKQITKHRALYRSLLRDTEDILRTQYFAISLDARLEFVVATHLLGYRSALEPIILSEASGSRGSIGTFVIDAKRRQGGNILKSEHRNALFVMASTPWRLQAELKNL